MINSGNEPVEISMHFSPEDWTEDSLAALVGSYQDKIREMGAPPEDVVTQIDKRPDGSASVHVSWDRRGTVMNPMTGEDASAGVGADGAKPGLLMYTEENGETYVEVQDEHSRALTDPVGLGADVKPVSHRQDRPAVPWARFVALGAAFSAAVVGIAWIRRKNGNKKSTPAAH